MHCIASDPSIAHSPTCDRTGKSPVVIDPKCDMKLAARRVLWGRFVNAGQVSTYVPGPACLSAGGGRKESLLH